MHEDFRCEILHEGKFADNFNATNGVKQGYVFRKYSSKIYYIILF